MCDIDFSESDAFANETERTARKAHRCSSCRGPIDPGQRYTVHFSVSDGSPSSEKMCSLCTAARKEFADAHGFEWCTPSYFPELLDNCIADGDEDSEQKWKPMLEAIKARAA